MRNSDGRQRNTWAAYVRAARETARLSQAAVADKMGINRNTVGRWELGRFAPDRPEDVVAFAQAVGVDPEEALTAAGYRPTIEAPTEPTRPPDPELDTIRQSTRLSAERKKRLIEWVLMRRARDEQARMEDLRQMMGES